MAKKILIVDDDPDILEAIQLVLDSEGYQTVTDTGEHIETKIQSESPELVLLDILLSGKDGREICKVLKNDQETKHIPVIMISAHADIQNVLPYCHADDFLPKPFDIDVLLSKIEKYTN